MTEGVAMIISIVIGFIAALGVANLVGESGAAQTKRQSVLALGVGAIVWFVSFIGLRGLLG